MSSPCRFCKNILDHTFCDLGTTPLSNSYLKNSTDHEDYFPLHALVCKKCLLVQLAEFQTPHQIFSDYPYFSSYSSSWVAHGKSYTEQITSLLHLGSQSSVLEIASNDGYLLQHFKEKGIPVLGIEPAKNVADVAIEKGIPTIDAFFNQELALKLIADRKKPDLVIGNNVLAQVPNINDFVLGLKTILSDEGTITLEFPHLLQLIEHVQFDTIYHEHFSYFSLLSAEKIVEYNNLKIVDVEELTTHGGSLRLYLQHQHSKTSPSKRVFDLKAKEIQYGLSCIDTYTKFSDRAKKVKENLTASLYELKSKQKNILGYGAPAKGNTLLNYCGISTETIPFTVDLSPHKQGRFLPGTRIPIYSPEKIDEIRPDYLLILPWNLKDEIINQMSHIRKWGGKFIIPIPELRVYP